MVELWEVEWNSSMLKHGRDNGTMEFIFAKGGTLTDLNYVMFGAHDDTWEPLIKAVAERDNSHPDIIRKQAQDPLFGVNPQTFQGAVPMSVGGVTTAVDNPRKARQLAGAARVAAAQGRLDAGGNRGRDMAATGQRMRGLFQGIRNIGAEKVMPAAQAGADKLQGMSERFNEGVRGAGDAMGRGLGQARAFMGQKAGQAADAFNRKFPGAKDRMKEFMQGAGRHLKYGPKAALGRLGEMAGNVRDRNKESALTGGRGMPEVTGEESGVGLSSLARLKDEEDRAEFMYSGQTADRLKDIAARRKDTEAELGKIRGRLDDQTTYGQRVRQLAGMTPEAAPEAPEAPPADVPLPEPETRFAPEDEADKATITDTPPADETPTFEEGPVTATPAPAGGRPRKDEPTPVFDEPAATGETATATPSKRADFINIYDERIAPLIEDEGMRHKGNEIRARAGRMLQQGGEFARTDLPRGAKGDALVQALISLGMTQAEAVSTAQDAAKGNPEAKKKVEAAVGGEQTPTFDEEPVGEDDLRDFALSSDKHEASWDSLLKGLNIR